MFVDRAMITIKAGDGGSGITSFVHYKGKVSGGPDGGDGGKGGNLIFVADKHLTSLVDYYYKTKYVAENGSQGGPKNCFGKAGSDLVLKVPLGTVIRDSSPNTNVFFFVTFFHVPLPSWLFICFATRSELSPSSNS